MSKPTNFIATHTPIEIKPGIILDVRHDLVNEPEVVAFVDRLKALAGGPAKIKEDSRTSERLIALLHYELAPGRGRSDDQPPRSSSEILTLRVEGGIDMPPF